ncbi:MAG: prolyl-tRNA synthetase associated domain-containing protein [Alphaproteobacteria bacterium]|nr:prolyl-tRNA synthetase associated domain-containing protein [Alphaproteobacteria bacterium]MDE2111595.1 prolyl-tRNA synthetase associated domain-containing protein [Alphaproteobacteria bacterium]MDE2495733.1 prolyl-tRNA synthetase associated domain-containing protein [Alphaproteobacteria bacterium]
MPILTLPPPEKREAALYERLRALGIAWKTYEHMPVFTVDEADTVHDSVPGGHTKNLFLKDKKGGLWLVVLRDRLRVDLNALARQLGAPRYSFGSADLLIATLGIEPGSVTPFALMNDAVRAVRPILDEGMLALDPLNFHPLRNDRTTAVSPSDLLAFVRACGHDPIIATLPEVAP